MWDLRYIARFVVKPINRLKEIGFSVIILTNKNVEIRRNNFG